VSQSLSFSDAFQRALGRNVSPAALASPRQPAPVLRDRVWELSPNLHCSIIGTCLTTGDLRQLLDKLGEPDARTAADHVLHSRGVLLAGKKDIGSKLLQKLLDRKHERAIKHFAKAHSPDEVRALWRDSFERGEIPGAYWAVLTHPATDRTLVQDAFGEVHMLSHLVGQSNRIDIRRLSLLEAELQRAHDKVARQEARLRNLGEELSETKRQLAVQEECARLLEASGGSAEPRKNDELVQELAAAELRTSREQARIAQLEERLRAEARRRGDAERQLTIVGAAETELQCELTALEAALADTLIGNDGGREIEIAGKTLLYVGGRPSQVNQLNALAARHGGTFLHHDGGVDDNIGLLPGLISQSDLVLFPVDCVSHDAAGRTKRFCRESGKPFVPLRSASVASFLAALSPCRSRAAAP